MRVWRVEGVDGTGAYHSKYPSTDHISDAVRDPEFWTRRPTPNYDRTFKKNARQLGFEDAHPNALPRNLRFGFKNLQQFHRWFDKPTLRRAMDEDGLFLVRYEVPKEDVIVGDTQVAFFPFNAEAAEVRRLTYAD